MIICAAIELKNCPEYTDTVVPCFRHGYGYEILHNLMKCDAYKRYTTEGFITHEGKFLNRQEALEHAINCGQLSQSNKWYKSDHKENELYSEDLY